MNAWSKKCDNSRQLNQKKKDSDAKNESSNRGKLIIDATCAPADITYPTDLGLLNRARVHTEKIIDILYKQVKEKIHKKQGIRISGPPLGRPPANVSKSKKKQATDDERIRNEIEGKFGQGKRRFGLNRVMAKLDNTSGTVIAITFLVMNLATWWRRVFCVFLYLFGKRTPVFREKIIYSYTWGNSIQKKLIFN